MVSQGSPIANVAIYKINRTAIPGFEHCPERIRSTSSKGYSFPDPNNPDMPDPTESLLGVMTDKSMGVTSGRFLLRFSAKQFKLDKLFGITHCRWVTWADLIDQHDLVVIELGRPPAKSASGSTMTTVMVGFVDDVYIDRVIGAKGEPHFQVSVTGTDLSEAIYDARLYWIESLIQKQEVLEGFTNIIVNLAKLATQSITTHPAKLVEFVLDNLLKNLVDFSVLGSDKIMHSYMDMLGWRLRSEELIQTYPFDQKFAQLHKNVESVIRDVILWPFHEFYTDVRTPKELEIAVPDSTLPGSEIIKKSSNVVFGEDGAQFSILLRPTPFPWIERTVDHSDSGPIIKHFEWWDHLKKHASTISEDDVITSNNEYGVLEDGAASGFLSLSRREIRSVYFVTPEFARFQEIPAMSYMPYVYNKELVSLYGFQALDISSAIFGSKNYKADASTNNAIKRLCWQLASWNNLNQYFLSGSKVLKLRPDIKIGTVLLEKSSINGNKYYYIEHVRHVWDFERETSYTELGVTRGLTQDTYDATSYENFLGQFLIGNKNITDRKIKSNNRRTENPTQEVWTK